MKTKEAINKIAIFGAGGQGREVLQLIQQINGVSPQWECIGWFDDGFKKGDQVAGLPVLGGMKEVNNWSSSLALVVAIAWSSTKEKIVSLLNNDQLYYPVLIHPTVQFDESEVQVGKGTIITQFCRFTINIEIGEFVLLNSGCTITHDVIIGDYSSVMPSVIVSGAVNLEKTVYVGAGTQIIQQLRLGTGSIIGAGSVVIRDIPAHCTAVGVPAKPIKFHNTI